MSSTIIETRKNEDEGKDSFVSVIIPVYNDRKALRRCLKALENQTYPGDCYEVVVVDNNSDEPMEGLVADYDHAVAAFEEKQGSYTARNRGVEVASGDIFAFTDADCIPEPKWLEEGVSSLLELGGKGVVGGRVEYQFQSPGRPKPVELVEEVMFLDQEGSVHRRNFAVTANMLTFRRTFDIVGLFNEALRSGGDMEWGQRAHQEGVEIVYTPSACVQHPTRGSIRALQKKLRRVTRGQRDLRAQRGRGVKAFLLDVLELAVPPIRTLLGIMSDSRVESLKRTQAVFLLLYFRLWRMMEMIRLGP